MAITQACLNAVLKEPYEDPIKKIGKHELIQQIYDKKDRFNRLFTALKLTYSDKLHSYTSFLNDTNLRPFIEQYLKQKYSFYNMAELITNAVDSSIRGAKPAKGSYMLFMENIDNDETPIHEIIIYFIEPGEAFGISASENENDSDMPDYEITPYKDIIKEKELEIAVHIDINMIKTEFCSRSITIIKTGHRAVPQFIINALNADKLTNEDQVLRDFIFTTEKYLELSNLNFLKSDIYYELQRSNIEDWAKVQNIKSIIIDACEERQQHQSYVTDQTNTNITYDQYLMQKKVTTDISTNQGKINRRYAYSTIKMLNNDLMISYNKALLRRDPESISYDKENQILTIRGICLE